MFGLDTNTIRDIKNCLAKFPQIDKALLYGSRAKENYKNSSDIDLTLLGKNLSLREHIYPLQGELDKLYLPYTFDISIFSKLSDLEFIEHILRVGKSFYQKEVRELPAGWEQKKLTKIAQIQTGKRNANHASNTGKFRFYTCAFNYLHCNTKAFSGKCLILPGNGVNVGEVFFYDGDFDAYQRTYVISKIAVNPKFLFYHLKAYWKQTNLNKQYGSATNFLKIGNFENYKIPLPPLTEQKRIASVLDKVFQALDQIKANNEKNLANAKELWESCLNGVFAKPAKNWEQKRLGEVCEVISGQSPDGRYYNTEAKGAPFYQGKKEFSKKFIGKPLKWTTEITKEAIRDDILMSVRAPVGPVNFTTQKICIGRGLAAIRTSKQVDKDFLFHFLVRHESKIIGSEGAVFASISKAQIERLSIPLPPLAEQKRIVQKLDVLYQKMTELQEIYRKKVANVVELKKAVLRKAFTGEL